jgi:SAM-dependent methyltransferase
VAASFAVADATVLDGYDDRFDTVISSALLHCLDPDQRRAHVAALRRVLRPGGRLIQFCFSQSGHSEAFAPYQIGEEELRTTFSAPGWTLNTLRTDRMVTIVPPTFAGGDVDTAGIPARVRRDRRDVASGVGAGGRARLTGINGPNRPRMSFCS